MARMRMIPIIFFMPLPRGASFPARSIAVSPLTVTCHALPSALRLYCPRGRPQKQLSPALPLARCSWPRHSARPAGAPLISAYLGDLVIARIRLQNSISPTQTARNQKKMRITLGGITKTSSHPALQRFQEQQC
jgi:hypothetical protein